MWYSDECPCCVLCFVFLGVLCFMFFGCVQGALDPLIARNPTACITRGKVNSKVDSKVDSNVNSKVDMRLIFRA